MARRYDLSATLDECLRVGAGDDPVAALVHLVDVIRPTFEGDADARVAALCDRLEVGPAHERELLGALIRDLVTSSRCVHTLTESGMPSDHGFWDQLMRRIGRRLLPEVDDPRELSVIARRVFHKHGDHKWLRAVEPATWRRLFHLLSIAPGSEVPAEVASAVRVLSHHVASLGLNPDITHRMPELDDLDSPFLNLSDQVRAYCECMARCDSGESRALLHGALETLDECRAAVKQLRANKHVFGTSLRLTTLSFRLLRQIERLEILLHLSDPIERDFEGAVLELMLQVVEAENTRNDIGRHVSASADLLAFQVVEHAAKKGKKYITETAREYWRFFAASLLGGLIVAVFALFKLLLSKAELSLAGEAFLYSINYALCFVAIYLFGGALATKQPAMTANTVAHSMDGPGGTHQLEKLAEMIVRIWRSQFISFVGNLLAAFPIAIGLAWLFDLSTGAPPATPDKALKLLGDVHPWLSGALFFAGVAGVFLFLAGLVSGYFENRNTYRKLSIRVAHHPLLLRTLGPARATGFGRFIDKHGGAIVGNVFLGFCLGTAGTLGVIFGLPFDIRHIAFSSANVGMALEGLGHAVPASVLLPAILGVILIGFVNFIVSFGLMLSMAMKSRRITWRENRAVLRILLRRLARRPWQFFIPPRAPGPPDNAVPT